MSHRLDHAKAAPEGARALGAIRTYLQDCSLPQEMIDLIYLRVSQINGCAYCIDKHSRDLLKLGTTVDKLVLVPAWREAGQLFDARERAALAWAESLTRVADTGAPDAEYEAAATAFSERELADLTYAIAVMNLYNRLGVGLRMTPAAAKAA